MDVMDHADRFADRGPTTWHAREKSPLIMVHFLFEIPLLKLLTFHTESFAFISVSEVGLSFSLFVQRLPRFRLELC